MEKNIVMWTAIGVLFLTALFLTYETSNITGNATDTKAIDTTGWTANEIMNYEMHGTIPAKAQRSSPSALIGSGMVGGC